jgi:inhibitor of cysteine peptidase
MGRGKMLRANESDNGRTVKLAAGESLEIALSENPTTGYRWQHAKQAAEDDSSPCSFATDAFEPDRAGMPGAGGVHRWQLHAVEPGVCKIELEYRRSWEKDKPPERTFRIHVEVRKSARK